MLLQNPCLTHDHSYDVAIRRPLIQSVHADLDDRQDRSRVALYERYLDYPGHPMREMLPLLTESCRVLISDRDSQCLVTPYILFLTFALASFAVRTVSFDNRLLISVDVHRSVCKSRN